MNPLLVFGALWLGIGGFVAWVVVVAVDEWRRFRGDFRSVTARSEGLSALARICERRN